MSRTPMESVVMEEAAMPFSIDRMATPRIEPTLRESTACEHAGSNRFRSCLSMNDKNGSLLRRMTHVYLLLYNPNSSSFSPLPFVAIPRRVHVQPH
ncbi:hypothetical protein MRB53_029206 [Persea americana]|uniref:Uncharacterized protein n=1 Tax=Persea americana TaxID=3435 RepID=A0ACC2KI30_PERAE|nr:hypothetical protein MRB53_029206 [Persea americana]